jgi:hypothetical protein
MLASQHADISANIIPEPNSGCWLWIGAGTKHGGYGAYWDKNNRKQHVAHRLVYIIQRGPIKSGLHLDHLCCNPSCVNPDHLEPVTLEENVRRAQSALKKMTSRRSTRIPYIRKDLLHLNKDDNTSD